MRRRSYPLVTQKISKYTLFPNAEEAWFWFSRCQKLRQDNIQLRRTGDGIERPCEPSDIYRIIIKLMQDGKISSPHIRILAHYGLRQVAPDPRCQEQKRDCILWRTALDHLTEMLRLKGLIETFD